MKLNKLSFIVLFAAAFFGSMFFAVDNVSADTACANLPDGAACKLDIDSKSFTSGTCKSQTCIANGTSMTTPAGVGSSGAITSTKIPGTTTENSGIIKCGRAGQDMCTLCDLIKGMNNIIQYLMKIAIGVALLAMTIGGVMYVVSAGDKGLIDGAKGTMKNAAIGFTIIFAGWLIINTTISYLGTSPGMGIGVTSWGQFECNARLR